MEPLNRKGNTKATGYTPGNPGDWPTQPSTAQEALDELAAQEAAGEVKSVTASAPLASTGGANPNITISPATQSAPGSLSAADKTKLDNLPASPVTDVGATAPITSTGGTSPVIGITPATQSAPGSLSAADKTKLDNLQAFTVPYTPTTPGNWSPAPADVGDALDQLAARPSGGGGDASTVTYTPATPSDWHSPVPGNVAPALDQIAQRETLIEKKIGGGTYVYRDLEPNPSGNVYATFDDAYAAAQTNLPATIVIDNALGDPAVGNACGQGGFVESVSGTTATLTRLHAMHAGLVGKQIGIYNASTAGPGTNGLFTITAVLSTKTIQINNAAAIVDDTFDWSLVDGTTAAINNGPGPLVLIQNAALPNGTNTAEGAFTPASVGQTVTLANTGSPGNTGTFPIVAYVSPTSVWIANASASSPDGGQLIQASGSTASIVSFDSVHNTAVITGLSNIPAYTTDWLLVLTGSASNDGNYSIRRTLSPTSVEIQFFGGTVPDPNNGSIQWTLSGQGVQLSAAFYQTIAVTGLVGIPSTAVGNILSIANTTSTPRATAAIIGWIDATHVLLNPVNSAFGFPDTNNGALWWYLGTNYDLSRITLAGSVTPFNGTFMEVRDGASFNQGIAAIRNILDLETSFLTQPYIGTLSLTGPFNTELYVSDESYFTGGNHPAFDFSFGSETTFYLWVNTQSYVDNLVYFDDNPFVSLNVFMESCGTLGDNLLTGTSGQLSINVLDLVNNPPRTNYSNFYGSPGNGINIQYQAKAAALVPFAQNGNPTPNSGGQPQDRYNVDVGTMYFDTGLTQPFWWSGSQWVSYQATAGTGGVTFGHATPTNQGYNLTGNQFQASAFAGDGSNRGVVLLASDTTGFSNVNANYVTVAGGNGVVATTDYAFIGGGYRQTIAGGVGYHSIVGGASNTISDGNGYSFIGGGQLNSCAAPNGSYNIIGGGYQNAISAGVAVQDFNIIVGGQQNRVVGSQTFGTIGGGNQNAITSTNANISVANTIAGGEFNAIGDNSHPGVHHSTIVGGSTNAILGNLSFIGGGQSNANNADYAFLGGGFLHTIQVGADYATLVGGYGNAVTGLYGSVLGGTGNSASAERSTAVGGTSNDAGATHTFVGGGQTNTSRTQFSVIVGGLANNIAVAEGGYGFIGGGAGNTINQGGYNTIAGGTGNTVTSGHYQAIAGGNGNTIQGGGVGNPNYNFIGGGGGNVIGTVGTTGYGVIGGGQSNSVQNYLSVIGGGLSNTVTGDAAFIGSGESNEVDGSHAVIAGGQSNLAGGNHAGIVAGTNNNTNGFRAFIGAGQHNQASNPDTSVLGAFGRNSIDGSTVIASGSISGNPGSSQCYQFQVRGFGSGSFTLGTGDNGSGSVTQGNIYLAPSGIFNITLEGVAMDPSQGDYAAWTIRVVVETVTSATPNVLQQADILAPVLNGPNAGGWTLTASGVSPSQLQILFAGAGIHNVTAMVNVRIAQLAPSGG